MLTGRRAFASQREETVADVIAAVLKEDPDWRVLPADTAPSVRRLLRRCLCKDVRGRLHDIADARLEIRDAQTGDAETATRAPGTVWLPWTLVGTFAVLSAVLAVLLGRSVTQRADSTPVYRSVILPPMGSPSAASEARTAIPRFARGLALTRDGKRLAFVAPGADGRVVVWVRPFDATDAQPLGGTEGATSPFWSDDGRQLAFVADRKLKRIDASGGTTVALYDGARPYRAARGTATTSFSSQETTRFSASPRAGGRHHRSRRPARGAQSGQNRRRSSFRMAGDFFIRSAAGAAAQSTSDRLIHAKRGSSSMALCCRPTPTVFSSLGAITP